MGERGGRGEMGEERLGETEGTEREATWFDRFRALQGYEAEEAGMVPREKNVTGREQAWGKKLRRQGGGLTWVFRIFCVYMHADHAFIQARFEVQKSLAKVRSSAKAS